MQNIVTEILNIMAYVKSLESEDGKVVDKECLENIHARLADLLSSCIMHPVQGRLSLSLPQSFVSEEDQYNSLLEQKSAFFGTT